MAKTRETFNKKDKEKKRAKRRQDKAEKMEERKANTKKGKTLDDMLAYIDEDGNLSSTPPDPKKMRVFKQEDMQIGVPKYVPGEEEEAVKTGVIAFFNDSKGFGFINVPSTGERVFIHVNQLTEPVKEGDKVNFEVEMGPRGANAINVKKI